MRNISYELPAIGDGNWVYRGKRFCTFRLAEDQNYFGFDRDFGDWIVYDKREKCVLAVIRQEQGKFFTALTAMGTDGFYSDTLEEAYLNVPTVLQQLLGGDW